MAERILSFVLLVCACLSVIVLLVVQNNISAAREKFTADSPAALNYLLQSDHNLDQFVDAVHELQMIDESITSRQLLEQNIRSQFDILWSSFYVFRMQFPKYSAAESFIDGFYNSAQDFLRATEPLMNPEYSLSKTELNELAHRTRVVSGEVKRLGHSYFVNSTERNDAFKKQIAELNGYMQIFIALLMLTGGLGIGLLIRSNIRTNSLFTEAQSARSELATTVDELRSGRREQKAKDSFIASASHDIRQPLHALGLFLSTLTQDVKPAGQHALNEAMKCTEDLNRLLNSMLDLSRLDAGVVIVEEEHIDLRELLTHLHSQLKPTAISNGIQFEIDGRGEACVRTDPILISRIIRNSVENALNHSGASKITLSFKRVKDTFQISITDNGKGIDEAEHEAVFSEYYQIDNPERDRSKGLGLGLSIVKRLTQLLDIKMELQSSTDIGTNFSFYVPVGETKKIHNAVTKPSAFVEDQNHSAVIVVVEDDCSIRTAMGITLENLNYRSVCAENTDEVLERLADHQLEPDLIIADYRLRNHLTGDQVIRQLRDAIDREIPGLIVTGDTSPMRVLELSTSGIEVMHKPVDIDILHLRIKTMLTATAAA